MRSVALVSLVALAGLSCSHATNPERKDPLTDQVTGALQPTARVFLADDPASQTRCQADADCPQGALCAPERTMCFTPRPPVTKLVGECPLVPLYFAVDSAELVPEAQRWVDYDARCLQERGAQRVILEGHADARGPAGYNEELSRRRAETVQAALAARGVKLEAAVRAEGESAPVLQGTSEHDYAYNRRVELDAR